MVHAQTRNKTYKIVYDFQIPAGYPIPGRKPDQVIIDKRKKRRKKKRACRLEDFAVPADHIVKIAQAVGTVEYTDCISVER